MSKQIIRLCRLQLVNLFGINEFLHTKDKGKKGRYLGLAVVWIMLIAMAAFYVGAFSYGLIMMEIADIVPMYLYAVASLLILIFSFFKAGSTLFAAKGYEMLVSLPVSRTAIIVSRFVSMYVINLLVELIILLPGIAVYSFFTAPSPVFYLVFLLGSLCLPLLPLTISSIFGALITAISARAKHKSLTETILMLAIVIGVMAGSMFLSENESQMTEEMLKNIAEILLDQIGRIYPLSIWFHKALFGDMRALFMLLAVPTAIFALFVAVLQKHFHTICIAIHAVSTKNNYQMTKLQKSSHVVALWRKELKRYFASSIYVTNTVIGYVMATLLSAGILVLGIEQIAQGMGLSGEKATLVSCLPFGLSCVLCITSISACSISMEGNTFWQIQSLPVTAKEVFDSKILVNLTVVMPFYVVSELLLTLAVKPIGLDFVWLWGVPLCYILFSSVVGITVNLAFPVLKWENEVRIVKQSASMTVTMLIGVLTGVVPLLGIVYVGRAYAGWISLMTVVSLLIITSLLYRRNNKMSLIKIGEK